MAAAAPTPLTAKELVPGKCYKSSPDAGGIISEGVCVQGGPGATSWQLGFMGGSNSHFTFTVIDCADVETREKDILRDLEHQLDYEDDREGKTGHITFAQALAVGLTKDKIISHFEGIPTTRLWMTPVDVEAYNTKKDSFLAPLHALGGGKRRNRKSRRRTNRKQKRRRSTRK